MSDDQDFDFDGAYGGEAAKAGGAKKGSNFDKIGYLTLKGKPEDVQAGRNVAIVRFLTDHVAVESNPIPWITVDMHSFVPTKPKPADWPEGNRWPQTMGAACRNDKIFKVKYGDCYICTLKKGDGKPYYANGTTWALAVLREEVIGTAEMVAAGQIPQEAVGSVVGVRDITKEVAVTDAEGKPVEGQTKRVPEIVIVQQKWKNFWSIVQGFAGRYKTVLDRDYHITRNGHDTDTTYQIVPLDPITMPDGTVYDLRRKDLMEQKYPNLPDLRTFVARQASDDYYALFFDPSKTPPPRTKKDEGQTGQAGPATPTPQSTEPSSEHLNALASRLGGYQPGQGAAPAAPPAAAPEPAAAPPAAPAPVGVGGGIAFE